MSSLCFFYSAKSNRLARFTQLIVLLSVTLLLCSPSSDAEQYDQRDAEQAQSAQGEAVAELATLLANVTSYRAHFSQVMRNADQQIVDQSSGKVAWQKPNLFRWDIEQPFEQTIVLSGNQYTQYDRDLDQVIIETVTPEAAELPKLLLSGDAGEIGKKYRVEEIIAVANADASVSTNRPQVRLFKLSPVAQEAVFQQLLFEFHGQQLVSVSFEDELDGNGVFRFSEVVYNVMIESAYFQLDIPDYAEVIRR